jgi:hypothetical protein
MIILLVAFLIASLAATAVSASHRDGTSSKVASVTVVRGVRASPGGSFYILPYYLSSVFQFRMHQPIIIQ